MMMKPIVVAALIVLPFARGSAQYEEEREYSSSSSRFATAGFIVREFRPLSTNTLPDSLGIRYNRVMPMVSFRQGTGELFFGYTTFTLAGSSKSTILFGGRFGAEIPVLGRKPGVLLFPLELSADYTKADGIGPSREDFNIASVGVGGGLKYRYFSRVLEWSIGIGEFAQFASEGIGVGTGFSAVTAGDAVIQTRSIGIGDGLVLGYRFRLQTWSMSESKFNYRSVSHGPYLGIMF